MGKREGNAWLRGCGVQLMNATARGGLARRIALTTVLFGSFFVFGLQPAAANHIPYAQGDVFAAVGDGKVNHYSPTGTLREVLDTGTGVTDPPGEETGMCFDSSGNLYTTDWRAYQMSKFNNQGGLLIHPFGASPNFPYPPESCVVNAAGNVVYAGQARASDKLYKMDTNGNVLATYTLVRDLWAIDWIDLNPNNQCEIYYTSEGSLVKRFNVCTNTQLSDFASGLPLVHRNGIDVGCFSLRIRSNGEVLVACDQELVRLNSSGSIIQHYNPGNESDFWALALDPDGTSFWAAGYGSGHLYKVNIASGSVGTNFVASPANQTGLGGLAVYGDGPASSGYPRPKGATPTLTSLVVAYKQCTTGANRTHGGPSELAKPSCNPPVQESSFLTVGTLDANGQAAKSSGSVRYDAVITNPDVKIATSVTDVRKSDLSDYTGELQEVSTLRLTDKYNSADPATQPFNDPATSAEVPFPVTVPCSGTSDTTVGSTCAITTSANAVNPGSVLGSVRTIWHMGQVRVFDGGSDGLASTAGNTLFMDEGLFVP